MYLTRIKNQIPVCIAFVFTKCLILMFASMSLSGHFYVFNCNCLSFMVCVNVHSYSVLEESALFLSYLQCVGAHLRKK